MDSLPTAHCPLPTAHCLIDYLVVGHITQDLTPQGIVPGGTAAYAALTARSLGCSVAVVTACAPHAVLGPLADFPLICLPSPDSTTFENLYTPSGRQQVLRALAAPLDFAALPPEWRAPAILHLGPVAREVDPDWLGRFPGALVCLTPQGWLRQWDSDGRVSRAEWPQAEHWLAQAAAAVISVEDVNNDEATLHDFAHACPVLAVTEGERGSRVYWNTHVRRIPAPSVAALDPTGAGDVYAAAFFVRLRETRDPYEAGRFATQLAAVSVTRPGLAGAPTPAEAAAARTEVLG